MRDLVTAVRDNDLVAAGVLADAGRLLGTAIAAITLVLDLSLVLLSGELAAAGELVLAPAQAMVDVHRPPHRDGTSSTSRLELGVLGEHAAATGVLAAGVLGVLAAPGCEPERVP